MLVFALHHRAHRDHVGHCRFGGHQCRVSKQRIGQRLQPGFLGQLALGAALELERQVNVFDFLLGRGVVDGGCQCGRQLALLVNRLAHRFLAVAQFAQVRQARFEFAQLDVIQAIGHLFAVTGDERHGRTLVQQLDGGLHLIGTNTDFLRDLRDDLLHGEKLTLTGNRGCYESSRGTNPGIKCKSLPQPAAG